MYYNSPVLQDACGMLCSGCAPPLLRDRFRSDRLSTIVRHGTYEQSQVSDRLGRALEEGDRSAQRPARARRIADEELVATSRQPCWRSRSRPTAQAAPARLTETRGPHSVKIRRARCERVRH
jgi:hypothetical protein